MPINNLPLILYGAGIRAIDSIKRLTSIGMEPECFCDSNVAKQGTIFHGLPILSFDDIVKKYGEFNIYITLVDKDVRRNVILYLIENGVENRRILNNFIDYYGQIFHESKQADTSVTTVIQKALSTFNDPSFLELGIPNEDLFISVNAQYKVGVDSKQPNENIKSILNENCLYYTISSSEYMNNNIIADKFNVIFIDGIYDNETMYKYVVKALNYLEYKGIIIIHNCKPETEIDNLPLRIYNKISIQSNLKELKQTKWCGDIWKVVVKLRSNRHDLNVFTINCDTGCAIITNDEPYKLLNYTDEDIKSMDFYDLCNDCYDMLNLKDITYYNNYIYQNQKSNNIYNNNKCYKLYVEFPNMWEKWCSKNYYSEENLDVKFISSGIVLPIRNDPNYIVGKGGVCDEKGNFIAGHCGYKTAFSNDWGDPHFYKITEVYNIPEMIDYIDETVVYGGFIFNHFGHMILECISRMWWFLENKDCNYKFVFISRNELADRKIKFIDILLMLGLKKENIILIKQPTQFKKVIVPDQASYHNGPFTEKAINIYNAIRDSVKPANIDKVFFTVSSKEGCKSILNKDYFEDYYRSIGFSIITPEEISIKEQVSIMAGAKEFVTFSSTLNLHVLFTQDNTKITILNKTHGIPTIPLWIMQVRKTNYVFIDVAIELFAKFFPTAYLFPTKYWKEYINDQDQEIFNTIPHSNITEYLKELAKQIVATPLDSLKFYSSQYSFADFFIEIYNNLIDKDLNEETIKKLYKAFPHENYTKNN